MDEVPAAVPEPVLTESQWRERQRNVSFAEEITLPEKMRERDALMQKAGLRRKKQP